MAKIDSVGRTLLPPDPGIKTQAFSARERAVSEPVMRALAEWFQAVHRGRRDATDEPLLNAVRGILTGKAQAGEATPRHILAQVIVALAPHEVKGARAGQHYYLAQLGQESLVVASKTKLEPGQTLILTPGKQQPQLLLPQTLSQARLILNLVQQQQVVNLPTPQASTALPLAAGALFTIPVALWAAGNPVGTHAEQPPLSSTDAKPTLSDPGKTAGSTPTANAVSSSSPIANPLSQTLSTVLSRWLSALPQAPDTAARPTNPGPAHAKAVPSATASPMPTSDTAGAGNVPRLQLSNHWIPQLIQAAKAEYGAATPQTVRQVWQQWQGQIQRQLPATAEERRTVTPVGQAPAERPNRLDPTGLTPALRSPGQTSSSSSRAGTQAVEGQTLTVGPARLSEGIPLLKPSHKAETQTMPTSDRPANTKSGIAPSQHDPGRVPADVWRLVAEQLVDTRLQQLGNTAPHSLQTLLQSRAQLIRNQQAMTYSPQRLKQLLQSPTGAVPPAGVGQSPEQQNLVQLRQLLEQVTQQQQARTLSPTTPEPSTETPRQIQGFPVVADQHLVWFDLERHPEEPQTPDKKGAARTWVLDLHFHLTPMAPICARLHWQGYHGKIEFLTDDMPTLRELHAKAPDLQSQLHKQGLPIDGIQCRHGLPKRNHSTDKPGDEPDSGGNIDVHT